MNLALITDAWTPQVNGVVRTLTQTTQCLEQMGHRVHIVHPGMFRSLPCPGEAEIRLAMARPDGIARRLPDSLDAIHIATEGPLGMAARRLALRRGLRFSSAYHTRFPEYLNARFRIPVSTGVSWLRRFHAPASVTMVPTLEMQRVLESRGFGHVALWSRGVDSTLFQPEGPLATELAGLPRPILLSVGRVAPEKNLEAFLSAPVAGSKVVIGAGPALDTLRARYPDVHFLGARPHEQLPSYYRAADLFVFPSRTDTFGLVMLEAMACGLPVAAHPVTGPLDVVADGRSGALDESLARAIERALACSRDDARRHAAGFSWESASRQFLSLLAVPASANASTVSPGQGHGPSPLQNTKVKEATSQ